MSKTHDYFLEAEAARERCRKKGPHDNLPMTKEEERKAWYDPTEDKPSEKPEEDDEGTE